MSDRYLFPLASLASVSTHAASPAATAGVCRGDTASRPRLQAPVDTWQAALPPVHGITEKQGAEGWERCLIKLLGNRQSESRSGSGLEASVAQKQCGT